MVKSLDSRVDQAQAERAAAAARSAVQSEISELKGLLSRLDVQVERSLAPLLLCQGRVVVTGLGKSGLVGAKIAATFSSTGTPSFFLHAADSLHGDSGVLVEGDVLIAISNSGATGEVCAIAQMAKNSGVHVLAMTGQLDSPLARIADVVLDISISREADPLNLAPTSSTTVTLALGDALASALMAARNFTPEDFARRHPSGALGKQLSSPETSSEKM
ncbi:MAG TPA: SIS domain-containing protein [Candidatus Paceibacterota bacterium]|nr:SIS domain-containing protein [Candidatus Paceibacterota bacterium]